MGPRSVVLGGADTCDHSHWGLRWSSLWGHEALHWVVRTHVITATEAFRGAPYRATTRSVWGLRSSSVWATKRM
eukprot:9052191-Pyramimonas_sp.AAC.1